MPHQLQPLLLNLHLLMLAEMLDVLRMRQILQPGILIMIQLPVMDLILVLVVAVVSRARPQIRQGPALVRNKDLELVAIDHPILVIIDQAQNLGNNLLLALLADVLVGVVHEPVGAQDLGRFPLPVRVVVVQREEGGGVEVGDVVLPWES